MTQFAIDRIDRPDGSPQTAQVARRAAATSAAARPTGRRLRRPGDLGGSARAFAPTLRPPAACPAPGLDRRPVARAHSCVIPAPLASPQRDRTAAATWRLTERGIAVVLVVGLMIMIAALTVVGLTAIKVTSDGYRATVSATLPR